jgi:hypothetical protein
MERCLTFRQFLSTESKAKQRIFCHPKMIMSYLAKIEISYDPGEPV